MADLLQSARLFETSAKLQDAASCLSSLAEGRPLDRRCESVLLWAGNLLSQVDWYSNLSSSTGVGGSLAVEATSVRPTFYASLIKITPEITRAGLNNDEQLLGFLNQFYSFLLSACKEKRLRNKLSGPLLKLGATLLHELSHGLLLQLSDNGVPRQNSLGKTGLELQYA